jgi:hypothetical protein
MPMSLPRPARPSPDDDLPGLPTIDGDDDAPGDDLAGLEHELDDGDAETEDVGLDTSTGDGDDSDLEVDDEAEEIVDRATWEATDEAVEEDPELGRDESGDEGGWTDGSEDAEAPGWDADLEDHEEPLAPPPRDSGEEGVDERFEGDVEEDAAPGLPELAERFRVERALDREDEEEPLAEDLDLEGEGTIDSPADDTPEHPALALERLAAGSVRWAWLGPDDDSIVAIAPPLAAGRTIYSIDGERAEPTAVDPLDGEEPTSIARTASGTWIVGLRTGGAARSRDARQWEMLPVLRRGDEARSLYVLSEPDGRLWGRTRGGALVRSDDDGATWGRPLLAGSVIALGRAADGGVIGVVGSRHAQIRIVRTSDGGRAWRSLSGPTITGSALPDECEVHVACHGRHVVIACDAPGFLPFHSSDEGQTWTVLDAIRDTGPLAILREGEEIVLYAGIFSEGLDRGIVVRVPLEGSAGAPEIAIDLGDVRRMHHVAGAGDSEGDQRIHVLTAERDERVGATTLHVGSGIGIVRARIVRPSAGRHTA